MAFIKAKNAYAAAPAVDRAAASYVLSFQTERSYQGKRYHWMVCREHKPDELVSWGHAPTRELAEAAAQEEVKDLSCGRSHGGRVTSDK